MSREVRADFPQLAGLAPVEVTVGGTRSSRQWFVVADLDAEPAAMLAQTADFALACVQARNRAGGVLAVCVADNGRDNAPPDSQDATETALAMDETGKIITVIRTAATSEVVARRAGRPTSAQR